MLLIVLVSASSLKVSVTGAFKATGNAFACGLVLETVKLTRVAAEELLLDVVASPGAIEMLAVLVKMVPAVTPASTWPVTVMLPLAPIARAPTCQT